MGSKSRTEYSILNMVIGLSGYVVNTICGLVCRMVFTRTLAVDYLGINGLFTNILSMLSLAELGIGSAIIYALYKPLAEHDEKKIASLVQFYGNCYRVIGCVVAAIGFALLPFLKLIITSQPNIKEDLYLIYAIYLFNTASTYFFSYRASLITAAQQHYIVTGVSYLITIAQSAFQMIWLVLTHEYMGYLLISSLGTLSYNLIISNIAKKKFPYISNNKAEPLSGEEKKKLVLNVRALTVWKISGLLVNSTDNIIITYFKGMATVGLASNYTLLSGTIKALLDQVFSSFGASVGNLNAIETKEKRLEIFDVLNFANFWLFGWAAIGICVVSTAIVQLLFGDGYVLAPEIPFVIALNFYMVGIQNAVWSFNNAMGLFRPGRYLLLLTAAINLVSSIYLGKRWGLFGILIATAISRLFTNTWYDPYKLFKHGFGMSVVPYYIKRFLYFLLLVAIGLVCYIVAGIYNGSVLFNAVYKFSVCCIIPNLVFLIVFFRTKEFRYYLRLVMRIKDRVTGRKIK